MLLTAARIPADDADAAAFLGVETSLGGKRWRLRPVDDRLAAALRQRLDLPEVMARVLASRGADLADPDAFLNPRLKTLLPDPSTLKDMAKGADRVADAVRRGETIALFGDYDVDGATATAVLGRFLRGVGGKVRVYVPDRVTEGYGPNAEALLELGCAGASLIVTLDCGVTALEPLAAAAAAGIDVVVVDHHQPRERLPHAVAVINPNRLDETGDLAHLAAVGVAFLLCVAVNRRLRQQGWYGGGRPEPDVRLLLDLVALGTVCDMVPLVGVNRAFVTQGLTVLGQRMNRGLTALADCARIDEPPNTYHLGFVFGPRINAGGRVGQSDLGARLLMTEDESEARALAARLDALNAERQRIEASVLEAAIDIVEPTAASAPILFAAGEDWHPGVVGIVASRLVERFNRPAFVISRRGVEAVASGRSVVGIDLGALVNAASQAGILSKGGGHAMAAGFTVAKTRLGELQAFMTDRLTRRGGTVAPLLDYRLDGAVSLRGANAALVDSLRPVGPFGIGNPQPRFAIADVRVAYAEPMGANHLRCTLTDRSGGKLQAVAFRCLGSPLGDALKDNAGAALHVAGTIQQRLWRGRPQLRFHIEDAAFAYGGA